MKETKLRDELRFLKDDKSAVLSELNTASQELKDVNEKILEAKSEWKEIRDDIKQESTRLDDIQERVVAVKKSLTENKQGYRNITGLYEATKYKNSQEQKEHLGKIKELQEKKNKLHREISETKLTFDTNYEILSVAIREKQEELKRLEKNIDTEGKRLQAIRKDIDTNIKEEKKLVKERLKFEDKLKKRENKAELYEKSLKLKEQDLENMGRDMRIIYSRLKELYKDVDPKIDLDKLVKQV